MTIKLIKARKKDTLFFYKLRNRKSTRRISLTTKSIKFNDHCDWFLKTINKKSNFIFIIKKGEVNCGYLRYEKKLNFYNVSICVDSKFNNRGIALSTLLIGDKKVKLNNNFKLIAIVKKDNLKSIMLFLKANYTIFKKENNLIVFKK